MKTALEAKNEFIILTMKELLAQKQTIIDVIKQFDGKVINVKFRRALKENLPGNILLSGKGYAYMDGANIDGIVIYNDTTRAKKYGHELYIQQSEITVPLIEDERNRIHAPITIDALEKMFAVFETRIQEYVSALPLIEEAEKDAEAIKMAIRSYYSKYHHSIRQTLFTDLALIL